LLYDLCLILNLRLSMSRGLLSRRWLNVCQLALQLIGPLGDLLTDASDQLPVLSEMVRESLEWQSGNHWRRSVRSSLIKQYANRTLWTFENEELLGGVWWQI
jgi:hypothetical protein